MLRVVLGICGGGLIAFGVFGGQALESFHRGVSGIFTPDTTVVAATTESVLPLAQAVDQTVAEVTPAVQQQQNISTDDEKVLVLASSDEQSGKVLEVQAVSQGAGVALAVPAVVEDDSPVILADNLVKASKAVEKQPILPAANDDLKADGVDVVLNATVGVPPSDTLFVLKERVNMREGPSTKHPVVLQLDIGQELMKFKRDGKWVHVGAYGTSGKIGWVHETLVGER